MISSPPKGARGFPSKRKKVSRAADTVGEETVALSNSERVTLRLLADTIVPRTGDPSEPLGASASDLGVDALVEKAIVEYLPLDVQRQFRQLLRAVESPALNFLLTGRPIRFGGLTPERREAYVLAWARSRLGIKRRGFHGIAARAARADHIEGFRVQRPPWTDGGRGDGDQLDDLSPSPSVHPRGVGAGGWSPRDRRIQVQRNDRRGVGPPRSEHAGGGD